MIQAHVDSEITFRRWSQQHVSRSQAWAELEQHGLSAEQMASIWDNYIRFRIARRNTMGWLMMGIGGTLGLVSCVLTMLDPLPDLRGLFMYGFTTVAVSMAFYGCYLVMEKSGDEEG